MSRTNEDEDVMVGDGVAGLAEWAHKRGRGAKKSMVLFDGQDTVEKLVYVGKPDREFDRMTFLKPAPNIAHTVESVDSFIDFLKINVEPLVTPSKPDPEEKVGELKPVMVDPNEPKERTIFTEHSVDLVNTFPPVMTFVSDDKVVCNMSYGTNRSDTITMPLRLSPEMKLLKTIENGVSQKALWRALILDLSDAFDRSYALALSSLVVNRQQSREVQIELTGLVQVSGMDMLRVKVKAIDGTSEEKDLPLDWEGSIQIWECFDERIPIEFRLELEDVGNGVAFKLHPKRLYERMRESRLALRDKLRNALPHLQFYDGHDASEEARSYQEA